MSALELTLGWVAQAVDGQIRSGDANQSVGRVVIDSRTLQSGDFFVALQGARFDGHAFVAEALERGASGAIVRRGFTAPAPPGSRQVGIVEAADTTVALQHLAHAVRCAVATRVVAITGSAGKTTTKETAAAFLATRFTVVKNKGNLNNHIGLPLSLLQLREAPDVAVMELGMNHAGEISALVAIAEPDVRVWTNVGDAHAGFFASVDAIADAKAEILERADRTDLLVYNADDARIVARVGRFEGRAISFGISSTAEVRADNVEDLGIRGMRARLVTPEGSRPLVIPLLGRGNLANVLAATAVALEFGVPLDELIALGARLTSAERRGAVHRLSTGIVLIDDSYNSSPEALRRALEVVASDNEASRKVAVLGEMLELGDHSTRLHEECGRAAANAGLAMLITIGGPPAQVLADAAIRGGMPAQSVSYVENSAEAGELVTDSLRSGDLVLVKGSRGIRTDIVADRVMAECA